MSRLFTILLFLLPTVAPLSFSQTSPKYELRGVYVTTTNSLDWPKTLNRTEQQASLSKIVSDLKSANFNAVFFQVRARGDAYYNSKYEPWAENLTGTLGADPGWDPLRFLLDEAHAAGIEVHAWFNVYKIRGPIPPKASSPQHPARAFPQWVVQYENESWLDPGRPEIREYLLDVLLDLAEQYDLDGICFDFIRYPGRDFDDRATHAKFGTGQPLDDWRTENINKFVRRAYEEVIKVKPAMKMGAAPLGNSGGAMSAQPNARSTAGGVGDFLQDSRTWLSEGWLDYLAPQVYWALDFETQGPDFAHISRSWLKEAGGRHIYISIGAYKPEILKQLPDQITATRMLGAQGQVFFRYENIQALNMFGNHFSRPAKTPPMPWKKTP